MPDSIPLPPLSEKDIQRFCEKIDIRGPNECWPWKAGLTTEGYGKFWAAKRTILASRVAYFLHHGADPFPLQACHSCDTPACCNGAHTFRGTQADNMLDKSKKGRGYFPGPTVPLRGSKHGNSKLTEKKVIKIRKLYEEGAGLKELGRRFGVSPTAIGFIVRREQWTHV